MANNSTIDKDSKLKTKSIIQLYKLNNKHMYKAAINISLFCICITFFFGCSEGESTEQTARPYSNIENIDLDIQNTLKVITDNTKLMLIFGANWCPTCRRIDASLKQPEISKYLDKKFVIIKVNVGEYDKNQHISKRYKTTMKAIPSMVILNHNGKVLERITPYKLSAMHKKGRSIFFKWIRKL